MTQHESRNEELELTLARRIDEQCDLFEAEWSLGESPRIESFLERADETERGALFRELLSLEWALLDADDRPIDVDAYKSRFPHDHATISIMATQPGSSVLGDSADCDSAAHRLLDGASDELRQGDEIGAPTSSRRFLILKVHGRGEFGHVYVARDRELNREVALKTLHGHWARNQHAQTWFYREAEIAASLQHPGIVPIYALGRAERGLSFYAMRLVPGESLKEALRALHDPSGSGAYSSSQSLKLRTLLTRFIDVCNAAAYAHSKGVVHRDIKPANILLGPFGDTLLADWGLAIRIEAGASTIGCESRPSAVEPEAATIVGTPAYMSPEQARGEQASISPASDVYSLGATLYSILTGRSMSESSDIKTTLKNVATVTYLKPRHVNPNVPRPLESICLKAMAYEPSKRYTSAGALADDVQRWLADEPVLAYAEPWTDSLRRWIKHHRTATVAAGVVVVAALVGLIAFSLRERAAARSLRAERDRAAANFEIAADSIDQFIVTIDKNLDVRHKPELASLRQELLKQPQEFYSRLTDSLRVASETNPENRRRLTVAYQTLGKLNSQLGASSEAIRAYQSALALLESRDADVRQQTVHASDIAKCYNELGTLYRATRQTRESRSAFETAIRIRDSQLRERPDDYDTVSEQARTYNNLGNLQSDESRFDEATESYKKAITLREGLARRHASDRTLQRELASSQVNLGLLYSDQHAIHDAIEYLEKALVVLSELAEDPTDIIARRDLVGAYTNLGLTRIRTNDEARASDAFLKAYELQEALARDEPSVKEFQWGLILASINRAPLATVEEALTLLARAREIAERLVAGDPSNRRYQEILGSVHNNNGTVLARQPDHAGALDSFELARRIWSELLADDSRSVNLHVRLAEVSGNESDSHGELREYDKALVAIDLAIYHLQQAITLAPRAGRLRVSLSANLGKRVAILRTLGRTLDANATAQERADVCDALDDPAELFNATCDLALGIADLHKSDPRRGVLSARALALLRRAIESGYRNVENLLHDPTLAPLRGSAAFDLLVLGLAFPDDPFTR